MPQNDEVKMNEQGLQNDCSEDSYSQDELPDQSKGMTRSVKANDQISQTELPNQLNGMTRSVKKTALYNKESRDKESINLKHSINNPNKEIAGEVKNLIQSKKTRNQMRMKLRISYFSLPQTLNFRTHYLTLLLIEKS